MKSRGTDCAAGASAAGPKPASQNRQNREDRERCGQAQHELAVEERQKNDEPQVHYAGGNQDAAGKQVRMLLPGRTPRQHHCGHRGGVCPAQQRRQHHSAPGQLLQHIAQVGDGADGHHHQPGLEGIDLEARELLVGQHGKNDAGEQKKLGEGEDFTGRNARGQLFEGSLQVKQNQVRHSKRGGNPEVAVAHQRSHHERGQAGDFRCHPGVP